MLDETVPAYLSSSFGTATNTLLAGGIAVAIVLAILLPESDDVEALKADGNWRIIYGFPYLCQFLTNLLFLTAFREDSIVFNIANGNDEDALLLIRKVYAKTEDPHAVLATLKSTSQKGSSNVTIGQATCARKYKKATWVAFALCFFQ